MEILQLSKEFMFKATQLSQSQLSHLYVIAEKMFVLH